MKNGLILILLCLILTEANSQRGRMEKYVSENNGQWSELYYVLKRDSSIKDGKYQKWVGAERVVQGRYKNNEKDSKWIFYSGKTVIAEGYYAHNTPVRVWKFYNNFHDLIQVYDFGLDSMLYFDKQREQSFYPDKNPIQEEGMVMPVFIGGQTFLNYLLRTNVKYPERAVTAKKQATVTVEFTIDTAGSVLEPAVTKVTGYGMDEEAVRFVNQLNGLWVPAKVNGQPMPIKYTLPVNFFYRRY